MLLYEKNIPTNVFVACKSLSNDDVGVAKGAPYFRRHGRELAGFKIGDFVQERSGETSVEQHAYGKFLA